MITLVVIGALLAALMVWRLRRVRKERQERALRMRKKRQRRAAQPPKAIPSASIVHDMSREAPEHRPLILVVDDSKAAREYTRTILEKQPYRVIVAENGRVAWSYLQDQTPDLIISDIDMPLMTGFELLRLVREDLRLADMPFILMTSRLYKHVQSDQAAGFDSLLPKPHSPEDLVEQVRFLLQE